MKTIKELKNILKIKPKLTDQETVIRIDTDNISKLTKKEIERLIVSNSMAVYQLKKGLSSLYEEYVKKLTKN